MIKIIDNDIWRGGKKIGWVHSNDIFDHEGKKAGYVSGNHVFNHDGKKIAYLEGDYINTMDGDGKRIRIEDNQEDITGGTISDALRAGIRLLLGD